MGLRSLFVLASVSLGTAAMAQVGVDGVKGSEWDNVSSVHVTYSSTAPEGNFGSPTNTTDGAGYDIYLRSDANYLYGLFVATDNFGTAAGDFANVYLNVNNNRGNVGSNLGFEIGDGGSDAFIPGGANGYSTAGYLTNAGFFDKTNGNITQEFAVSWDFLTHDPDHMHFDKTQVGDLVTMRISQTFGYSAAGGASYGSTRLGQTTYNPALSTVPGPPALAVFGFGLFRRVRRRRASK